jgi:hypothetical protein
MLKRHQTNQQQSASAVVYMIANDFHRIAGHINKQALHQTAKYYGLVLQGKMKPCMHCALANLHRSPINSDSIPRVTSTGELVCIDISKLTHPSLANNKFWLIAVDDHTDYTWSYFIKQKTDTSVVLLRFVREMEDRGSPIRHIRCYNAEENCSL